ncbi:sugar phosphate isomerase/epimerase [Streptomyces sp. SL13]|uniref:Sugar phosphate isomerase/epimerase n=1 Tax=Streptantibioticus silvisoli TaxID=2705255 RepID=A0AA90H0Y5_9ACTN|nr:sugar phosphate isomerase/epimerase [Streptantibioticus silvisoli]MDI5963966.1 sugar phosphate isomerase/epimerase [Streptantibioticus silvisoli]MDI5970071.1 sugar phosphate isomerase/epimerase [Streptantibioticus silvisoli]
MTARLGVSTSVLSDKEDLDGLLGYRPDVVEFYNYPSTAIEAITGFCRRHGIQPALHCPTPYDERTPLTRYAPTGPDPAEARLALDLALGTVDLAARIGAAHVVVHFPSPYPPYPRAGFAAAGAAFLGPLQERARDAGVPVLLENLTPNPLLRAPADYARLLAEYPLLGFCLDVGHAHRLGGPDRVAEFLETLGPRIRSLHFYGVSRTARPPDRRPASAGAPGPGPLDLAGVLAHARAVARPDVVVLEHGPVDAETAAASARWVRARLEEHEH